MAVSETLQIHDRVTSPAERMGAAVDKLAASTGRAAAQLRKLTPPASRSDAAMSKLRKDSKWISDGQFSDEVKKARQEMEREHRAVDRLRKPLNQIPKPINQATKEAKKLGGKDALGAMGLGGGVGSGILTAAAGLAIVVAGIGAAVSKAKDLAFAFAESLLEAGKLRDTAKSLQDTLSGGRGDEVLARIKTQAIATGQSLEELQRATTRARDAGLGYKEAFKLNLLRADIIASGRSAEQADSAIGTMLEEIKSKGKSSSAAMKELADKFGVVGDGAKSVEKAKTTMGGLLTRLKAAPGNIFEELARRSGPQLDVLGGKLNKLVSDFIKSGEAGKVIDKVSKAIDAVVAGIEIALPIAQELWEGFKTGFGPVAEEITKIADAFDGLSEGDKGAVFDVIAKAARGVGIALGFVAGMILRTIVGFGVLMAGIGVVGGLLAQFGSDALQAGKNLIDGLVNGIKSGIQRAVDAAKELADKVKAVLPKALQMRSPSKIFEGFGGNIAKGLAQGIDAGAGDATKAAGRLAAAPIAGATGGGVGGGTGGRGGVVLNINVTAAPGATKADGEAMASGLVPIIRREVASWLEGQLLEAGA